jgi:hypothetical protein
VVAAAHHLRLRKAEMVAGATAAVLLRKRRRYSVIGRTTRTKLHQLRPPSAVGSGAPRLHSAYVEDEDGVMQMRHDLATCHVCKLDKPG